MLRRSTARACTYAHTCATQQVESAGKSVNPKTRKELALMQDLATVSRAQLNNCSSKLERTKEHTKAVAAAYR